MMDTKHKISCLLADRKGARYQSGFTLIELLIVIGILAVLSTATVLMLNPAQMLAESKDSTRLNDVQTLNKAVNLSNVTGFITDSTTFQKVYISLPSTDDDVAEDCINDYPSLPPLASGWIYNCAVSDTNKANLRKIDGNGWLPVNFSGIQPPLSVLPVDPINNAENYYAYGYNSVKENYAIASIMTSTKHLDTTAVNDGGNWDIAYETRPVEWVVLPSIPNVFTLVDTAGSVGFHTSIAIGADGLPVISSWDNTDLKVAKCGNAACSSGNTLTSVDTAGDVGDYSSIAKGADGLPIISYYDETNRDLKVAKCGNAACSSGNTLTSIDTAGDVGYYSSIAIGADGLPVISYLDGTNLDLKVAKCGNAACSSGNIITSIDTAGAVGHYSSIAIGADGLPVISYLNNTNGEDDLKVAKCGNATCSSGNIITSVDTADQVGHYSSIAIGADGLPVISYLDTTNLDLKVAKCGNAACSSGNTLTSVDTAGDVGTHISIAIGADGLPVISYLDGTNLDLKVAKCGNAACSSGNTLTSVDTAGSVGFHTSIAIGADGLPVISYQDSTSADLKVVKCGNAACNP